MTKYRICKNKNGLYKIQKKTFLFWKDYVQYSTQLGYMSDYITIFKTRDEVESMVIKLKEEEQKRINSNIWECEGEY